MGNITQIWTDGSYQRQSLSYDGHGGWAIYVPSTRFSISDGEVINDSSPYRFELLSILAALQYINSENLERAEIINDNEKAVERCRGLCAGRADIDVVEKIKEEVKKLKNPSGVTIRQKDGKYDREAKEVDRLAKDACRSARPKGRGDDGGSFAFKPNKAGGFFQ